MQANKRRVPPQPCSINEFNKHLKEIKWRHPTLMSFEEFNNMKTLGIHVPVTQKICKLYLLYRDFTTSTKGSIGKVRHYVTDLNGAFQDGSEALLQSSCVHAAAMSKIFNFPRVNGNGDAAVNASGFLGSNPKYDNKLVYAYEYDKHLAWGSVLRNGILPDCSVEPRRDSYVQEGEIGFLKSADDQTKDCVVFEGWADYVFPIYKQTDKQKAYLDNLNSKINSASGLERKNLKNRINFFIGTLQNKCAFARVAIISQSNKEIQDLKEKYNKQFVFSVTDSFGSTERIPELESTDPTVFGGWSLKREGWLLTKGLNRFWLDKNGRITESSWRGMPSEYLIGKHYTEIPDVCRNPDYNLFKYDENLNKVVPNV